MEEAKEKEVPEDTQEDDEPSEVDNVVWCILYKFSFSSNIHTYYHNIYL